MHRGLISALTLALVAWLTPPPVFAQIGPDEARSHTQYYRPSAGLTLRTQVELVEVPVVVRDRKHQPVAGLTKEDFSVFDLGKKQEIVSFSTENFKGSATPLAGADHPANPTLKAVEKPTTQPRFIALCFDDLVMDPSSMTRSKIAAKQFIQTSLAPGDRVAVVTTAYPGQFQFTSDVPTILGWIDKVNYKARVSDDQESVCPPIRPYEAYLLANALDGGLLQAKVAEYRACMPNPPRPADTIVSLSRMIWERIRQSSYATLQILDGVVQALARMPGRRMILMASSGFYSGDLGGEESELIGHAIHSGVVINTLGARGLYTILPGGDASEHASPRTMQGRINETRVQSSAATAKEDGLAVLASGTGGAFFHNNNDLLKGFRELGMVPEVIYVLSFAPTTVIPDGRFHNLKVTVNKGGYSVQARMGYSAPPKPLPPSPADARIDDQMNGSGVLAEIQAKFSLAQSQDKTGMSLVANVDVSRLKFEIRQKRHTQTLTFVVVLRDSQGNIVIGQRNDLELNLTDATYTNLAATGGLNLVLPLKVPPGTYTARALLVEGLEGKMLTSNGEIVFP